MTNLTRLKQASAAALIPLLLLTLLLAPPTAFAAVSMGEADPIISESNADSTVVASFSPELGSTIQAGTSTDAVAYYGVVANSSASSSDVFWQITVSHETEALASGDVTITEKGWFDDFGHDVADSAYSESASGGDLVLTGNSGWSVEAGANFTNVDEIAFDPDAPLGEYTITRELMDNSGTTTASMGGTHTIIVELTAAPALPDVTPPDMPLITSPISPHSTSTNPIIVSGTAESESTIEITGGAGTANATTSGAGNWSATVNLNASSTNTLAITAEDSSGNVSSSATLVVTHSTDLGATTTPPVDDDDGDNAGDNDDTANSRTGAARARARAEARENDDDGIGGIGGDVSAVATAQVMVGPVLSPFIPSTASPVAHFVMNMLFARPLGMGSTGTDVAELQRRLAELGLFKANVTGYFGSITAASLRAFQRGLGLAQSGSLDAQTMLVLNNN